jgi:hypothetical protein
VRPRSGACRPGTPPISLRLGSVVTQPECMCRFRRAIWSGGVEQRTPIAHPGDALARHSGSGHTHPE